MSYKHLTTFERSRIDLLHQQGFSARQIGKILGRHHSTISRELNRNTWSPEQISHTLPKGVVCFKTIYQWLYQVLLAQGNLIVLR